MPDVDLDFADARRDEVLAYVREKYGNDHVAQIITFGTMAARAAVRDAGRALGYPYNFCDQTAKLIPMNMSIKDCDRRRSGTFQSCITPIRPPKNCSTAPRGWKASAGTLRCTPAESSSLPNRS